ncbi:hypothetical protein BH11MYX3_BH11MYX3_20390 [soil metagenome]
MFTGKRLGRVALAFEVAITLILVSWLTVRALRQMDYLDEATRSHIRMTDESRTAYVAKNLVEGRGYTANDLPAALVDFYDQKHKLHDENWVNADRFPFAAFATAALYKVTGSTSWETGILLYNILFFIAFVVALYATATTLWGDRYAGLFAVTIALIHPYTWMFLYWKDGDMLLLSTLAIGAFVKYFRTPPGEMSRLFAIAFGSLIAFIFLARPNLGVPFILVLGGSIVRRLWLSRRQLGLGGSLRTHATRELVIPLIVLAWCIPFILHTMAEWGQPLFSANNLYQLPLGTRYGMGTDTWWKYTETGHIPTFGVLVEHARGELLAKFTTSWVATIRHFLESHLMELVLAGVAFMTVAGRNGDQQFRPLRLTAYVILFAVVTNLLLLPLYSYQNYSFRHYLAFVLPLIWIAAGRAVLIVVERLKPALLQIRDHMRAHPSWYVLAGIVAVLAWNIGAPSQNDVSRAFARTSQFVGRHWLGSTLLGLAFVFRRALLRPPWFPRIAALMFTVVYACYRPSLPMKRTQFAFAALDERVWDALRERTGLVSSFALQGEVAWNTGRKNIPAPEWPMHLYSFRFDHALTVEDVYIESADAMVDGGPFSGAAPGFEGYMRLQRYRSLPGYEVTFHSDTVRGYPKFRVKPMLKGSTVFTLTDVPAAEALRHVPARVELGDPNNVIYTAHGWGDYYSIEGKHAVIATNRTRDRYFENDDAPYEDSSITLFVDERTPKGVELEIYAPQGATYDFFWNLDLYAYDRPQDRTAHRLGTYTAPHAGWQTVTLEIPPGLLKYGLNKLGFRAKGFVPAVTCPKALTDDACVGAFYATGPVGDRAIAGTAPWVVRADGSSSAEFGIASLFAGAMSLRY